MTRGTLDPPPPPEEPAEDSPPRANRTLTIVAKHINIDSVSLGPHGKIGIRISGTDLYAIEKEHNK